MFKPNLIAIAASEMLTVSAFVSEATQSYYSDYNPTASANAVNTWRFEARRFGERCPGLAG